VGQQRRLVQSAFRRELRIGMTQGESLSELLIRIRGRAVGRGRYQGGVMAISTRNASALIRTATNDIANKAAFETYKANPEIAQAYEWLATLDPRTCPECAGLDGKVWEYDDPKRRVPPAHFSCRCTILPVIDWKAIDLEEPANHRRTYPEWFQQQPAAVQDQILGPSRAKLVRDGKATFDDLVRRDGSMVTLEELEREMV
jgi:SPP1 gp7 family putative phage head morphogenesis protein